MMKNLVRRSNRFTRFFHWGISGLLSAINGRQDNRGVGVACNDCVITSHTFFSHPVVHHCLSQTYNAQVKNAVAWEEGNR